MLSVNDMIMGVLGIGNVVFGTFSGIALFSSMRWERRAAQLEHCLLEMTESRDTWKQTAAARLEDARTITSENSRLREELAPHRVAEHRIQIGGKPIEVLPSPQPSWHRPRDAKGHFTKAGAIAG